MPLNATLQNFSTDVLVQELIERRQQAVVRLDAAISLWSDAKGSASAPPRQASSAAPTAPPKKTRGKGRAKKQAASKAPAKAKRGAKAAAKTTGKRKAGRPAKGEKRTIDYAIDALRNSGRGMSLRELTDAAKASGWNTASDDPAKVLGAALFSAVKAKKGLRMKERGVYELAKE